MACSNSPTFGPKLKKGVFNTAVTASMSRAEMSGRDRGMCMRSSPLQWIRLDGPRRHTDRGDVVVHVADDGRARADDAARADGNSRDDAGPDADVTQLADGYVA